MDALIAVGVRMAGGASGVSRALMQHTLRAPTLLTPAHLRAHICSAGPRRRGCMRPRPRMRGRAAGVLPAGH